MRYSVFLASGLAAGAVAMPALDERALRTRIKTEVVFETVRVVVTVTRSRPATISTSLRLTSSATPTLGSGGQSSVRSSSLLPGAQPSGIDAPIGGSLTSSTLSTVATSSSRVVSQPPIIVSTPSGGVSTPPAAASSSSVVVPVLVPSSTPIPSVAGLSSVVGSSLVAVPTSIQGPASSVVVSSSSVAVPVSSVVVPPVAPAPTPSSAPAQYFQEHVTGTQQAFLSSGTDYQNAILYHHNAARANHNAAPLVWDTTAEANARIAAEKCTFAHYIPPGVSEGQNLFTVSGTAFNVTAGITESWYKSEFPPMVPYFGAASIPDSVFHSVGHLTQVLWKGTTGVGCVSLDCGANMIVNGQTSTLNKFTVCNYSPPGNIATLYADNVGFPIQSTNLGSWAD